MSLHPHMRLTMFEQLEQHSLKTVVRYQVSEHSDMRLGHQCERIYEELEFVYKKLMHIDRSAHIELWQAMDIMLCFVIHSSDNAMLYQKLVV